MSLRRTILTVLAFLFTAGMTSVASACCGWGVQAPVAYASAGCGGCGTPTAAIVYAQPVAPTPPVVAVRSWDWTRTTTWGTSWGSSWGSTWGTGCRCHRAYVYAATPAVELTPIAPAPIYVVNQGPNYTGPGIMVPYHTWTPASSYVVPGSYPRFRGYGYGYHRWGYRYGWHRPFLAPRVRVSYGARFYGHPFYHRPAWGAAAHRFYR